jgi:predicted  nucleic acid-binding Zn-ribbon protein
MELSCIHCGHPFTISQDQLGGHGQCPHCGGSIRLPRAEEENEDTVAKESTGWWQNSISGLISVVVHMCLLLILALIGYNSYSGEGLGEDVLIGELPSEILSDAQDEELNFDETTKETAEAEADETLEVEPTIDVTSETELAELTVPSPSSSGGDSGAFNFGAVSAAGGSMAGGSWDGLLQNLRRNGLDIVITFDSTGSMGGEIREVKEQIKRIGDTIIRLVPKARIGLCTYRDVGEEYLVRGLPLTNDTQAIETYLRGITASAGGDTPEAVQAGLRWSVEENKFRANARKVILIFGDAPPHRSDHDECLRIASDFHRQSKGIVSTVTCRRAVALREFEEIAQMGGGESFLTTDERQIMTQLLILVFGSRYRSKVLEAFKGLDE